MQFTLIGMSGAGKSYWSKIVETIGYRRYSCDELIAERFGKTLGKGEATLNLSKWMGEPFSKGHEEAEVLYLKMEKEVVTQICNELEKNNQKDEPVVIDSTGSLIYLEEELINRVRKLTKTVLLEIPVEKYDELFYTYTKFPKPIIWNGKYNPLEGEDHQKAMYRCFRELLNLRNKRYESIADLRLDYSFHYNPITTVENLLDLVEAV